MKAQYEKSATWKPQESVTLLFKLLLPSFVFDK